MPIRTKSGRLWLPRRLRLFPHLPSVRAPRHAVVDLDRLEVEELGQRLHVLPRVALVAEEPEAVRALQLRGIHLAEAARTEVIERVLPPLPFLVNTQEALLAVSILATNAKAGPKLRALDAPHLPMYERVDGVVFLARRGGFSSLPLVV